MDSRLDPHGRDRIARDLESSDEDVRRLALERIGSVSPSERPRLLASALGDPSWRVRKAAVALLVELDDTDAVAQELIAALADGDNPGRRNSAVEALMACGPRVVPALLEAASAADVDVRKFVVDALAGIGDPAAGARVIELLADSDPNVRAAAADALGALGTPGSGAALLGRAVDTAEDATVRFSCLRSLGALDAPVPARDLVPVLEDPILRAAGLSLLSCGEDDESVAALLSGLGSGSRSVREAAMGSLVRVVGRSEEALAQALCDRIRATTAVVPAAVDSAVARLADADLGARLVLVQFLGLLRDAALVLPMLEAGREEALSPVVLDALATMGSHAEEALDSFWSDLAPDLRRYACILLGRTAGERGAARLVAALEDREPEVRIAAALGLRDRGDSFAQTRLATRLLTVAEAADLESEMEYEVAEELGALRDALIGIAERAPAADPSTTEAAERLRSRLEVAGETARLQIVRVLGRIGRPEDARVVIRLLKDSSPPVRRAAVDALARLEPGTAAEPLRLALGDEAATVRIAAVSALGASRSDDIVDDLLRLAADADPPVRAAAMRALGARFAEAMQDARRRAALEALEGGLVDDALVALAAVEALSALGGPDASRALVVLDRDEPELVREAVQCLAAHAEAPALDGLVPLIEHPDWSVRAEAIEALARRGVLQVAPAIRSQLGTEKDEFVREVILRALEDLGV